MIEGMPNPSSSGRSVKIGADERTGWSSERPRRDGAPPRPLDVSVRNTVLRPSDRLRYSPGSLLLVTGAQAAGLDRFLGRVIEERGIVFTPAKVRTLLAGRVPEDQIAAKADELLRTAVAKRMGAGESAVVAIENADAAVRRQFVELAFAHRRPRHLLMVEAPNDQVQDDERPVLDDMRRTLTAGQLGNEGFHTAIRVAGNTLAELKRIVFRPAPADD
jgi:predicted kinase